MTTAIRPANEKDIPWIVALLVEGTRDGHFGPTVSMQAQSLVQATLSKGGFVMMKGRGGVSFSAFVPARLDVAEANGEPSAFLLSLDHEGEVELHLAGTRKEARRLGLFEQLVQAALARGRQSVHIARCYRKSTWAVAALHKAGFTIRKAGDPVELVRA